MAEGFPGKILVIDDNKDLNDIYDEVLTDAGYKVDVARNGAEGLSKIYWGGYDLILLDIMMPIIDGMAILQRISDKPPEVYNGPIIVMSELSQQELIDKALKLGAKGWLVKSSLTPDQIVEKVSEVMQKP